MKLTVRLSRRAAWAEIRRKEGLVERLWNEYALKGGKSSANLVLFLIPDP
jgi:hypothetical protein